MASDVSQRAREAAASLIEQYWSGSDAAMMQLAKSIRAGHRHGAFVQAFARFEAEIRADATAIERERCALVADDEQCEIFEDSPEIDSVCNAVVREIAAAIRKGPTP